MAFSLSFLSFSLSLSLLISSMFVLHVPLQTELEAAKTQNRRDGALIAKLTADLQRARKGLAEVRESKYAGTGTVIMCERWYVLLCIKCACVCIYVCRYVWIYIYI